MSSSIFSESSSIKTVDALRFLPRILQLAHMLDPGFFRGLVVRGQLILDCFGHQLTEWNSALAAVVLARRKMRSGISKVVFMTPFPIFMGRGQIMFTGIHGKARIKQALSVYAGRATWR